MTRKKIGKTSAEAAPEPTQTITLTHGLKELKLLDSRIVTRLTSLRAIRVRRANEPQVAGQNKAEFETAAKAATQAIRALLARRDAIKAAIVQANATTIIQIGNERMTVAAAIERKRSLEVRRGRNPLTELAPTTDALIAVLSAQHAQALNEEARIRAQVERDTEARVAAFLSQDKGKDKSGVSDTNTQEMERLYRETNAPVFDDPLNLIEEMTQLREDAEMFASEVDRVLDETNALTTIVVPASA